MRTRNSILTILSDVILKIITLVFGIIVPKLYIECYGSEANGLLSSISGIFVYINLLEAGVGGASLQGLYLPLTTKDDKKVNGIMSATSRSYKITGIYFLTCVSITAFLYPLAIKSTLSYCTIFILIFISAFPSVIRFFYQGKYTILLSADNKVYILNLSSCVCNVLSSLIKILLILKGYNIVITQLAFSLISLIQVLLIKAYINKNYEYLDFTETPDYNSIKKKNNVMVHEISNVIFNNIDTVLITFFLGLKVVSLYSIYNMIFTQVSLLLKTLANGIKNSLGQLYFENGEKFFKYFKSYENVYITLTFLLFVVAGTTITPFLSLYMKNGDINYIDVYLPFLFMLREILSNIRWPAVTAINIAGHFKETQRQALIEIFINVSVSLILIKYLKIYGLLIGTIISLLYRTTDIVLYSCKNIIVSSPNEVIKVILGNTIISGIIYLILFQVSQRVQIHTYGAFFLYAVSLVIILIFLYNFLLFILTRRRYTETLYYIKKRLIRRK